MTRKAPTCSGCLNDAGLCRRLQCAGLQRDCGIISSFAGALDLFCAFRRAAAPHLELLQVSFGKRRHRKKGRPWRCCRQPIAFSERTDYGIIYPFAGINRLLHHGSIICCVPSRRKQHGATTGNKIHSKRDGMLVWDVDFFMPCDRLVSTVANCI